MLRRTSWLAGITRFSLASSSRYPTVSGPVFPRPVKPKPRRRGLAHSCPGSSQLAWIWPLENVKLTGLKERITHLRNVSSISRQTTPRLRWIRTSRRISSSRSRSRRCQPLEQPTDRSAPPFEQMECSVREVLVTESWAFSQLLASKTTRLPSSSRMLLPLSTPMWSLKRSRLKRNQRHQKPNQLMPKHRQPNQLKKLRLLPSQKRRKSETILGAWIKYLWADTVSKARIDSKLIILLKLNI